MKNFNFFEKLWEHSRTLRRVGLVLVMCLITITQMWADDRGFWDTDAGYVRLYRNNAYEYGCTVNKNGTSDFSIGNIDSDDGLYWTDAYAKVWGGTDIFNSITFHWRVKGENAGEGPSFSDYNLNWHDNMGGTTNQYWNVTSQQQYCSISGLAAGYYEVEFYFSGAGKDGKTYYANNNGGNYHANFTLRRKITYHTDGSTAGTAPSTEWWDGAATVRDNTGLLRRSDGYVFAGWADSKSRADAGNIDHEPGQSNMSVTLTADLDLYPVWKPGYYLITPNTTTKDGTNFIATRSLANGSYTVNGVQFSTSHYNFSSQTTSKGVAYDSNKHILYDTKTDNEDLFIYAKSSSGTQNLYYTVIKDGLSCAQETLSVSTSGVVHKIPVAHHKKSRVVIAVGSANIKIANIKVVKHGSALAAPCTAGYRLSFPGRMGIGKNTAYTIDGITLYSKSDLKFGEGSMKLSTAGTEYIQFTTSSAIQLKVKISTNKNFYVCTNKSSAASTGLLTGGTSGTYNINLPVAGTYYITGNGNDCTVDSIMFAAISAATAPTAFASTATTSTSVTLSITDATNSKWEIYYSTSSTPPTASTAATEDDITSKTPTVTGLTANTDYYMWVRSVADYFNKSSWVALTSNPVSTDDTPSCSATAPGTISKGTLSGCSITLTASGSAASNNTWYWQASADGTSTSESGATKDVTAPGTYYIRSFYSTGSCWSDAESYTITASDLTPAAPSALAAASPTAKGVTLTVTDAANTNDYEFYVSTDDDEPGAGTSATHSVTDAKSLTITNLVAGTTYYAWARAKCGSNKSDWIALGSGGTFTTSTVSADYHLTNVTKTTGATSGIGGSEFEAVFAAVSGYSMPNPTVTIDGNSATSGTDYTWNAGTGTLTINANKINGNIDITLNSAAAAPSSVAISGGLLYFAGETIELTATPTGGNGPVTYQWYKGGTADGNAIEGATNATYTKASCAFGDAGSYYCKVTCGGSQSTWGQSGNAYDVKIPRLYVKTGHYYDLEKSDFGNVDFTRATASTATASIVLGPNGDYCFNIADGCGHYYGNSGTMQYNNTGWITNVSPQDCGLTTTNAGTYIFTINYSNWSQLTTTITFPSCTDPGLAFASASKSVTLCDDAPTNALTNTHGVTVSYESSDTDVAEVASDGTITLVGAGETTITASSLEQTISAVTYCADNASYTLTVNASTAAGLAYGTSTVKKDVGDDAFTNALTNSHSLEVTYASSDEGVATVASDGEVTIKAAGTTTITASSAQQKVSSTCYDAGSATYTLTVYPVYTVTYNAMGGTCSPTSTNTTTALGKVTLPSATHAIYTTYTWVTSDGTEAGDAGDTYTPEGNINLYAKWSGSCAGGGGSGTSVYKFHTKTGMTPSRTINIDKSVTAVTTSDGDVTAKSGNYLSELSGGTLGMYLNGSNGYLRLANDSCIYYNDNSAYMQPTLSTATIQRGDILRYRISGSAIDVRTSTSGYSANTDVTLATGRNNALVSNSMHGLSSVYLYRNSNSAAYITYFEIYRPSEVLFYAEAATGMTAGNVSATETQRTTSDYLTYINGGNLYTGGNSDGDVKITANELQLKSNNGYIKITLSKELAEGDIIIFNSSNNYQPCITLTKSRSTTISTTNKIYPIPADNSLIGESTIYLWRGSGDTNIRTLAIVRPGGGTCYSVTYHGNGATSGYVNDPAQYAKDADPEVLDCGYTRTGYAFIGWADGTDHRDAETVDYKPGDIIEDISSDVTLYAIWKQIKYFKGTSSSSWNTSGNWSPSGVPARTDPVVIQANVTVDTDEAKALRVDIETGNTLTINAGMALIIAETLTKAGGATEAADVIINSTRAAGVGALIIGGETGTNKATVNFATKVKRESGTGNWINQFIGSPFSDLEPYVDYALQIYEFRPADDGNRGFWHKLSSGDGMEAFWGYNVLYNDNDYLDVQWTGTLNASSNNVTKTGSNEVQTDNLFANSWVAPIHIAAFEEDDFTNFDPTIYIFNAGTPQQEDAAGGIGSGTASASSAGTYAVLPIDAAPWVGMEVIPAMQAFFVKAIGASPSIKFDYSKLVYTPALSSVDITPTRAPRRSAEVAPEVIRLHVAGENGWAENTYVLGREDFTEGYDRGWDGRYMEGEDTNPQLYTPTTDGYMAVNCVPEIEGTVVGFRKGSSDNNYIFSFDYDGDEVWYLNDQKAQKSTQIMNGQTYAFVSEAGDNAARFVISATPINKIATGCESVGAEAAKVRKVIIDDKVYIIRGGQVFDVLGKTIKK